MLRVWEDANYPRDTNSREGGRPLFGLIRHAWEVGLTSIRAFNSRLFLSSVHLFL